MSVSGRSIAGSAVLVTGAASGMGEGTARIFAEDGGICRSDRSASRRCDSDR
ncbi:Uncharacterised protein [Mycobacteroides abscessus subsp. abscessus]|nr:Uncharacterised protein [Mycobacteroides abscessus subsp. abscessus]